MSTWDLLAEGRSSRIYQPGQMIYLQGAQPDCFYYLQKGTVHSFISLPNGEERVIKVHHTGDLMGEASFFDQCPRVTSAVAMKESRIIAVTRSQLDELIVAHPELALPMLQHLARTVRILSHHVNDSVFPAEQRIIRYLLKREKDDDGAIHCTHEEIGQAVGASRVTVSRTLSNLTKSGIIKTGYGSIWIMDSERINDMNTT